MLHEFITLHRDAIMERTRAALSSRPWPAADPDELESGVPLFLTQLTDILAMEVHPGDGSDAALGSSASRHGGDLLARGFNISQVVHAYGDICQAITSMAVEENAPITNEEFKTLNRCLDTAIAEAVTEHARLTANATSSEEVERLGELAHEMRDVLNTAFFAFHALKAGSVPINGSTGAVLGRALMVLRNLTDTTLAGIRMEATKEVRERVCLIEFLNDIAVAGSLDAEYRGLHFKIDPVDPELCVLVDPQLLASAVNNLLSNAFKFTHSGGRVQLRAHRHGDRALIEVQDECGGIPESRGDPFQPFGDRRGKDRTGLGLGLAIARNAVRAQGGDITITNTPGTGCVFVIALPAYAEAPAERAPVGQKGAV